MKSQRDLFLIALLLFVPLSLLAGCATTKGKVADGNYSSPLNNFVIPLPTPFIGSLRIQDRNDADTGIVSFLDDFGNNNGVTYLRLTPDLDAVFNDPARRDSAYRSFVHDYAMKHYFLPVSAQSKIVREEFLYAGPERAFFAIVAIPEVSSVMDMKAGKRLDSHRALLVFDKKGFMYMLHTELVTALTLKKTSSSSLEDKDIGPAQNTLQRMRASIRFQ